MKFIAMAAALALAGFTAAVLVPGGRASASHVEAEVTVPGEATVGQPMEVQAALRSVDGGLPLVGTQVIFTTDASFGGVEGEIELGRSVTDENGVATLTYEPRSASVHELRIEYILPGDSEPELASTSISVTDPGSQLHQSTAGIQIPGLNVWLLIALVATVWAILLSVALRVIAIARDGSLTETGPTTGAPGAR
ncbi:MAG: hypothetical protein ACE5KY_07400 [Candidatus Tectimicrobiota bacterium]